MRIITLISEPGPFLLIWTTHLNELKGTLIKRIDAVEANIQKGYIEEYEDVTKRSLRVEKFST
jgi:hypothetical protein